MVWLDRLANLALMQCAGVKMCYPMNKYMYCVQIHFRETRAHAVIMYYCVAWPCNG